MSDIEASPRPKLPLGSTIRLSYAGWFRHFGDLLRIAVLWLALIAVLDAAGGWMQATWMARVMADPSPKPNLSEPVEMTLLGDLSSIVIVLAAVSIALAWHRLLLLGEKPGRSASNVATLGLWRYIVVAIMIGVLSALPALALLAAVWLSGWMPAADDVIAPQTPVLITALAIAYLAGLFILTRLSLLLPASAAGNSELSVTGAWRISRGNGWRLLWGSVACGLPPFLLSGLVYVGVIMVPVADGAYRVQWAVAGAIAGCCWLLSWPVWIGFLSHAYRHFFRAV